MRRTLAVLSAAAVLLGVSACGSTKSPASSSPTTSSSPATTPPGAKRTTTSVVIGSANFAENEILAQIYADALKAKGVKVRTHLDIGSREIYFKELKSGAITVFPEYNGALLLYLDPSSTAVSTSQVDAALAKELPSNLEELKPAAAQDKDSVTVTQAFAKAHHLKTIEDLKPIENQVTIGGPPEFRTREEGLVGLRKLYGLHLAFKPLDESGPLTITALRKGAIQAGDIFTTDPSISKYHFVALADPKHLFASQNVIPIVNKKDASPTVVKTLDAISATLSTANLEQLVAAVENDHQNVSTVAAAYVQQAHLG
jgi:osmoprotectant transport system substrate-binding protein